MSRSRRVKFRIGGPDGGGHVFKVEIPASHSVMALRERLEPAVTAQTPSASPPTFSLSYTDRDGDTLVILDDTDVEELVAEASWHEARDRVFRVNVVLTEAGDGGHGLGSGGSPDPPPYSESASAGSAGVGQLRLPPLPPRAALSVASVDANGDTDGRGGVLDGGEAAATTATANTALRGGDYLADDVLTAARASLVAALLRLRRERRHKVLALEGGTVVEIDAGGRVMAGGPGVVGVTSSGMYNLLGIGAIRDADEPAAVTGLEDAPGAPFCGLTADAEGTAVFAYTSTAVYAWGAAWLRGDETGDNVLTPILLFEAAPGTRIVHVDAGVRCSVVVTDDGMLFTHGAVAFGAAQPAGGSGDVYLGRPVRVAELADRDVVYAKCVAYSKVSPYVVTRDGCVLCPDREAESDHSLPWRDDVDLSANLLVSLGLSSSSTATILSLFADDGDGDGER